MTVYRITADTRIEAEDLDDAFDKLARHFDGLRDGCEHCSGELLAPSRITVTPEEAT